MAYNKLYTKTTWNNDNRPAINADNLNHIEKGIDDIDSRVVTIGNELDTANEDIANVKSGLLTLIDGEHGSFQLINDIQVGKAWNNDNNTSRAVLYASVKPNTKYTISFGSLSSLGSTTLYTVEKVNKTDTSVIKATNVTVNPTTITTSATTKYIGVQLTKDNITLADIKACKIQLEEGENATPYTEYVPSVAQINNSLHDLEFLGWEVPSACPIQNSFDGKTFTQRVGRVDLGTLEYGKANNGFYADILYPDGLNNCKNAYCPNYTFVPSANGYAGSEMYGNLANKQFAWYKSFIRPYFRDDAFTDGIAFANANKGVYLYFELATPIIHTVGNEAVERVNDSLSEQGLINLFDGQYRQGYYTTTGEFVGSSAYHITSVNKIKCNANDIITVKANNPVISITIAYFNSSGAIINRPAFSQSEVIANAPENTSYFYICLYNANGMSVNANKMYVCVNNQIDVVKADLQNAGGGGSDYSTTETVVGKWIDGRNIYRKTFVTNNYSVVANSRQYIDLLGSVDFIINQSGYVRGKTNDYLEQDARLNIPFYFYSGDFGAYELECKAFVSSNDTMKLFIMWNTTADLNISVSVDYVKK